jgi:integrase
VGSIRKRNGRYQAQIRRDGATPVSKTFTLKKDAVVWVRGIEARIDVGEVNITVPKLLTLRDILLRYLKEITPQKKGREQESRRINRLLRDPIADFRLSRLNSAAIAAFRDRRVVDGLRAAQIDMGIIRHAVKIASQEWGVSMPKNPVDGVRVPNGIKRRDRRLLPGEYEALKEAALQCRNLLIWPIVQIAIETGMRRSEILSLCWINVDLEARIVTLLDSKNGSGREIPLSMKAVNILTRLSKDADKAFPVSDYSIRHGWDRLVKRASIDRLRFHDLRHEAVSRFFEMGLSVPEVAAISGHKDYRMLASYTHVSAKNLAQKI